MSVLRTVSGHVATAVATLLLVVVLFGDRLGSRPTSPETQAPRPIRSPDETLRRSEAPLSLPASGPPTIPDEILKRVDADEQVNILVYQSVNKSVVNITTVSEGGGLFGDETSTGTGSGFVIDQAGHILTNFHVVEGAPEERGVQVTLYDGSTHDARVVGTDASNDVAVVAIKVPAEKLIPVRMGDSSRLLVGQKILALGNPFGLERTLTTGIISSLDRSLRAKNGRMMKGIIQTDAAINPGNSGGPLLNSRGEVIGINTAIYSQVGQSAGISFAVPINSIVRILKPLVEFGHVTRADLGITRVFTTSDGLLVLGVAEGGPAARAGIQPIQQRVYSYGGFRFRKYDPDTADLILAINGKQVRNVDELLTEIESHAPGEVVKVTLIRDGGERTVPVRLGQS